VELRQVVVPHGVEVLAGTQSGLEPLQVALQGDVPPQVWPVRGDVVFVHLPCVTAQDVHFPVQALSQQNPSTQGNPPAQSELAVQACPCLALHAPVESHVPGHPLGSSRFLTAVQTLVVLHVRQAPAQSLRFTHPTHWLVAMSQVAAEPVQYEFAVHPTHMPLPAQAGPDRPTQSASVAHFAQRLPRQRGVCDGHSLSALQVPGASTGRTSVAASGPTLPPLPPLPPALPPIPPTSTAASGASADSTHATAASGASADSTHATAASGACVVSTTATAASGACVTSSTGMRDVGCRGHVSRSLAVAGRACRVAAGLAATAITTSGTASNGTVEKARLRWRDAGTSEPAQNEDSDDQKGSSGLNKMSRSRCRAHWP
jgi:hypothetical protein